LAVAVMAAFLAVATFLSNEAVKEVITGETHQAEASGRLESNRVRIDIARGFGRGALIGGELRPVDARLNAEIHQRVEDVAHANTQHVDYEMAEVGLEMGIVLASVSIITRRRWLLGAGCAAAVAGIALLLIGLLA
jgi:hypothetical protein